MGREEVQKILELFKEEWLTARRIQSELELRGIDIRIEAIHTTLTRMFRGKLIERRLNMHIALKTFEYKLKEYGN